MNLVATIVLLAQATIPSPAPTPQLPVIPNVAPGYAAPKVSPPPPGVVGVTQSPFVGITIQNAIGMALEKNPDLAVAQSNRRIALYGIQTAKGGYDVHLSVQPQYQYNTQAPTNSFFSGPGFTPIVQRNTSLTAGASGTLAGGQTYDVSISGTQTYDNTQINTFNPTYPTIFSVDFTQPLGPNHGANDATHELKLARINADSSDAQTLTSVSSTISQVQDTYWDLVAAWRNVAIQETALRDTITQQHSNVRLARRGATAPIDVVQTNTQIAVFQENVFAALQNVANLQNQLKSELLTSPNDPIWSANLVPTTPALQLPSQPALTDLVTQALRDRPEIAQIRSLRNTADENLKFAGNQTKPQFDLQLGYTSNGFAGTAVNPASSPFLASQINQFTAINQLIAAVNPTLPPAQRIPVLANPNVPTPQYLQGGLGQSLSNLFSNKFPVYTAGVLVTFPLGNNTARGNMGAAQEQERIALIQEASTIQRVTYEVRNALQAYQSAQARLLAATSAREASEQVLASEERRFHAGTSTTFLVLQREIELADNRGLELSAQTDLNKAVVDLQRSTGTILSANNVNVTTVGEGALTR